MKNTIAIGIPDKAAEKDNKQIMSAIDNLVAVIHGDGGQYREKHGRLKAIEDAQELLHKKWVISEGFETESKLKLWEKEKTKVIEFDLPKGYSAEDAYYTASVHVRDTLHFSKRLNFIKMYLVENKCKLITYSQIYNHFGVVLISSSIEDCANFYLLLAAANGHKLE